MCQHSDLFVPPKVWFVQTGTRMALPACRHAIEVADALIFASCHAARHTDKRIASGPCNLPVRLLLALVPKRCPIDPQLRIGGYW